MADYFAHSKPGRPERDGWEPLAVHLRRVSERAASFAGRLGLADEARAAGLLHDLGKYSERFQARLAGKERGLDHWTPGACAALEDWRRAGLATASVILGHHVGLGQCSPGALGLVWRVFVEGRSPHSRLRLTEQKTALLRERLRADGLDVAGVRATGIELDSEWPFDAALDLRLLFSTLVDSDYLETASHFEDRPVVEGPTLRPREALDVLVEAMPSIRASSDAERSLIELREELFRRVLAAAPEPPGLFTLSAPTGSGKTLAMLAFALAHAETHGLDRVIFALPFLSIIDQTAKTYRDIFERRFGPDFVLEQHSLVEPDDYRQAGDQEAADGYAPRRRGQLAENWDAPLVVTTNVQLLESLFANRPGRCRKLHRLARSVIVFDEVQTLPLPLAVPSLAALSRLATRFQSSVVLATATQPAFDSLDGEVSRLSLGGWRPREIAGGEPLFGRVRRCRVRWDVEPALSWSDLARALAERDRVLAIVNLKRHARELALETRARCGAEGVFHLSTNLCPAHRRAVLERIHARLDERPGNGATCRVIATQCVEAGVDLDFPFVYRAEAPLEAIAQAAGRCNRHGRGPLGEVVVFRPAEQGYPGAAYRQATEIARAYLAERGGTPDLEDPELHRGYYLRLYGLSGRSEAWRARLAQPIEALDLAEVAEHYRLIETDAINVVVPWDREVYQSLRNELSDRGALTRDWVRRARGHAVGLYRRGEGERPGLANFLESVPLGRGATATDWFVYVGEGYDEFLGLVEAENAWIA